MPENRLELTISAQNLASQAFRQLQADVRQSNEALQKSGQTARQSSGGIKVYRDELGRFHDAVTGRYVSAARLLREGFTEVERDAGGATDAIKRANPVIARMRQEYNLLRTDIHNTAAVSRQFAGAIQAQIRVQVDAAANLERLRVGLVSITGSIAGAEQQYRRLVEVSRLPGINIENSLRASLQLEALGKSGEDATEIIREFGNALALSGTAPRELNQVINAIRQMSGEGKILQEDIAILTTRVAALVPHLKAAFGGTRAEDVREFFDALGVDESEQADRFLRIVLDRLKELPRAGETAANAIENLSDTTQRVQAVIGANFLPIVKEATAGIEALLMQVEQDEGLARNIATVEAFGASWLGVTAALTGVAAAIPAVSAAVSFLFTGPAAIAVGVVATLVAGFVAWKVASQEIETEVDRLNSTIDQNRRALVSYQEAVTSGQLADIQSAQRGLQSQRQGILRNIEGLIAERHRVQEQRDQLQSQIDFQQFQGFEPSRARQDRLSGLNAQVQNLNKSIEVAKFEFLELGQSGRHLNELGKPLVDANVNTEELTQSIKDLKAELQEEVAFEDVSRGLLGADADFRKSATALADIETLVRLNTEAYEKLEEAAGSGNQEAVKGLGAVNKELNALRDAAADRHINNLSLAFEKLSNATDPGRKQLEEIRKSAEAFAVTFQGGANVLQDDVARALVLISQVREQLQALSEDELRLEAHDEGAQSLTEALIRFYDLQRTVQEDAGLDAQQSAEKQAAAYIRAYRDSIDPAILNLVQSVRLLREEVRGTIQDLEALNLQDELRIELNEENLSPVADFFTELVDLQQAAQGNLTRSQIENLEKRSQALKQQISEDTFNFAAYADDIAAIDETLTDKRLSLLEGEVETRQAQYEDDLRAQRQVEDQKQQKVQETHDYATFLLELRRKGLAEATQEFVRLEERAADVASQKQRENLIRETTQFIDAYAERGEAFRELVADAQNLGAELQEAFDLTEQQKRLEGFRDGLQGVFDDLIGITLDHFWDSFTDGASAATDAVADFTTRAGDALRLLESDILRLQRFNEDSDIRGERLQEDKERRIQQLRRQQQALAARVPTGNQRAIERNIQRQQDIRFRISQLREDFSVRISRQAEDAERRRSRLIEDSTRRREQFESRQTDASLLSKLADTLASSVSSAISSALGGAVAGLISGALSGHFTALTDAIKGLFGTGGETQTTTTTPAAQGTETTTPGTDTTTPALEGDADVDGTIKTLTVDPALAIPNIDVAGVIKSAAQATDSYTAASVDVVGSLKSAVVDGAYSPITVDLKGLITSVMLAPDAVLPVVNLRGVVNQLSVDPAAATVPTVNPAAVIQSITTDPAAEVPQVNADGTIKSLVLSADAEAPDITTTGRITSLVTDPTTVVPDVTMTGKINELTKGFTEPINVDAKADVELNLPDTDLLPPIDLGGLRFINTPNVPLTFTADTTGLVEAIQQAIKDALGGSEEDTGSEKLIGKETTGGDGTESTGSTTASIVAGEGRRDKVFGTGNPTVQTNITPEEFTKTLIEGQRESQEVTRSALHDLPRTIAEGIGRIGQLILGSGLIGVGVGDTSGTSAADQTNADVAGSLKPEGSPRNDFVVTLPANPFTNQGTRDPDDTGDDDEVAQAPAAVRFDNPADALNTASNLISAAALAGVAQDSTVASLGGKLDSIRMATERVADQPLVEQLRAAGVVAPQSREDLVNSFLPDVLTQGGIAQLFNFENLFRNLTAQGMALPEGESDATGGVATDVREQIATLATESTLLSMGETLTQIQSATVRMAEMPLADAVSGLGENLLAGFENVNQTLTLLQEAGARYGTTPNLAEMPGSSESNPMYMHMVNQRDVQDVRLVGGKVEVTNRVQAEITNKVRTEAEVKGTVNVEGIVGVNGVVDVNVINSLAASLDIDAEGLHIALRDAGVAVDAVGA